MALPSRLRVLSHLRHERSEAEATMVLAKCNGSFPPIQSARSQLSSCIH